MTRTRHGAAPKPDPRTSARTGALITERYWRHIAATIAAEMHPHLRKRTSLARLRATTTVHTAIAESGLLPIGGDIDVSQADAVADVALTALRTTGQLSERAERQLSDLSREE